MDIIMENNVYFDRHFEACFIDKGAIGRTKVVISGELELDFVDDPKFPTQYSRITAPVTVWGNLKKLEKKEGIVTYMDIFEAVMIEDD